MRPSIVSNPADADTATFGLTALRLGAQERARLDSLLSLFDFQAEAQKKISHGAWERITGASADEITMRWNHEAYEHIRLKPRILVDVSKVDTRVKLFGEELPFPIVLAPTGAQSFVHPEGDLASVRGAGAAKATLCFSSSASIKVEDVAKAATGSVWFQLYVQRDRGFTVLAHSGDPHLFLEFTVVVPGVV